MKLRGRRQLAVCGRLDLKPSIGGLHAEARIIMADVGHGIDKPKQQRAVMEHNYEWFSQWIWGEKPAQEGK